MFDPRLQLALFAADVVLLFIFMRPPAGDKTIANGAIAILIAGGVMLATGMAIGIHRHRRLYAHAKAHGWPVCTECAHAHDREVTEVICPERGTPLNVEAAKASWKNAGNV